MKKEKKKDQKKYAKHSVSFARKSKMDYSCFTVAKNKDNESVITHKYRWDKFLIPNIILLFLFVGLSSFISYVILQEFMETRSPFRLQVAGHGEPNNYYALTNLTIAMTGMVFMPMLNLYLVLLYAIHTIMPLYKNTIIYDNTHIKVIKKFSGISYKQKNIFCAQNTSLYYTVVRYLSFHQRMCINLKNTSNDEYFYKLLLYDQSCNLLFSIKDMSRDNMMKVRSAIQTELKLKKINREYNNSKINFYENLFRKCVKVSLECYVCFAILSVIIDVIVFHSHSDILKSLFTNW